MHPWKPATIAIVFLAGVLFLIPTGPPTGDTHEHQHNSSSHPVSAPGTLYEVTMASADRGYIGGAYGLMMAWNGTSWRKMETPLERPIRDIVIRGDTLYVSYCHLHGQGPGSVYRYRNGTWKDLEPPDLGYMDIELQNGTIWATGHRHGHSHAHSREDRVTSVYRYRDGRWLLSMEEVVGEMTDLEFEQEGFAVGTLAGHNDVLFRHTDSGWVQAAFPTRKSMIVTELDVYKNRLIGVGFPVQGYNRSIALFNGSRWRFLTSPTGERLFDLTLQEGTAWIVGEDGTILHWNGTFTTHSVDRETTLYGIEMVDEDTGWAVGTNRTILHWNGDEWNSVT